MEDNNSIQRIISELIQDLDEITVSFYQQKIVSGNQKLINVIDSFASLIDHLSNCGHSEEQKQISEYLKTALSNALQAMVNKDYVLLADILKYDISNQLNNISEGRYGYVL